MATFGLASALVLAGCGGTPATPDLPADSDATAVYDTFNSMSGEERTDLLVEQAKEEGVLTIYTSNSDLEEVAEQFESTYGIKVESTRGNSETVIQKLMTEAQARSVEVDLVESNANEMMIMAENGLFSEYESEYRDALRDDARFDGWTADRFNAFVVGWNTDRVDASEIPDEIKDFADPKWKGRIAVEIGDVDWFAAVTLYYLDQGMTQAEVDEMWEGIAANATVEKGHSAMGELLAAGKLEITLTTYNHNIDRGVGKQGAPLAWNPDGHHVGPVPIRPNGAGVVATAEHPAAATLFMDFLLNEGQQTFVDEYRMGVLDSLENPLSGVDTIPIPLDEMIDNFDSWDDRYRDLFGG